MDRYFLIRPRDVLLEHLDADMRELIGRPVLWSSVGSTRSLSGDEVVGDAVKCLYILELQGEYGVGALPQFLADLPPRPESFDEWWGLECLDEPVPLQSTAACMVDRLGRARLLALGNPYLEELLNRLP